MTNDFSPTPIDESGFWAFVSSNRSSPGFATGGYITMVRVGPFDFMRLDYTLAWCRDGLSRPFSGGTDAHYHKIHTILIPPHELPTIEIVSRDDVCG